MSFLPGFGWSLTRSVSSLNIFNHLKSVVFVRVSIPKASYKFPMIYSSNSVAKTYLIIHNHCSITFDIYIGKLAELNT